MAALTADRNTQLRDGALYEFPCAAAKQFYTGAGIVLDTAGNAEPATVASGKQTVGRCESAAFLSTSAAAETVKVRAGTFKWANSAVNTLTKANIGDIVYWEDDQTVGSLATGMSAAGRMVDIETDGVWVMMTNAIVSGLAAANNLSDVSNAGTSRTNLGVGTGDSPTFADVTTTDDVTVGDDLVVTGLATVGETLGVTGILTATAGISVGAATNGLIKSTRVAVTAAELKALTATPKTLVAAVAGKMHQFLGASFFFDYGSEVLAEPSAHDDPIIKYVNGSGSIASSAPDAGVLLVAAGDRYATAIPVAVEGAAAAALVNVPLVLCNASGHDWTGNASNDSVLYVTTFYREVTP